MSLPMLILITYDYLLFFSIVFDLIFLHCHSHFINFIHTFFISRMIIAYLFIIVVMILGNCEYLIVVIF